MKFSNFVLEDGVYCQRGFSTGEFENEYFSIRSKEGRIYDDDTVRKLPAVPGQEWTIRSLSAKRLLRRLKDDHIKSIVEVGCGNGWLINYLQSHLDVIAYGIDVGKTELKQASRISAGRATFFYGDVFSSDFDDLQADVIILAACIQYFPDLKTLIDTLSKRGTVHIIDSPLYKAGAVPAAHARSQRYFDSNSASKMASHYFHHEIGVVKDLGGEFLYKPGRIKRLLGDPSPFPWIRIRKG